MMNESHLRRDYYWKTSVLDRIRLVEYPHESKRSTVDLSISAEVSQCMKDRLPVRPSSRQIYGLNVTSKIMSSQW